MIGPVWLENLLIKLIPALGDMTMEHFGYKKDEAGNPLLSECKKRKFNHYVGTRETLSLFRGFYYNYEGSLDAFVEFWSQLQKRLGNNKYVMGIDPFNEPTWTSTNLWDTLGYILFPGDFDH
jgi:hypothetical protein